MDGPDDRRLSSDEMLEQFRDGLADEPPLPPPAAESTDRIPKPETHREHEPARSRRRPPPPTARPAPPPRTRAILLAAIMLGLVIMGLVVALLSTSPP